MPVQRPDRCVAVSLLQALFRSFPPYRITGAVIGYHGVAPHVDHFVALPIGCCIAPCVCVFTKAGPVLLGAGTAGAQLDGTLGPMGFGGSGLYCRAQNAGVDCEELRVHVIAMKVAVSRTSFSCCVAGVDLVPRLHQGSLMCLTTGGVYWGSPGGPHGSSRCSWAFRALPRAPGQPTRPTSSGGCSSRPPPCLSSCSPSASSRRCGTCSLKQYCSSSAGSRIMGVQLAVDAFLAKRLAAVRALDPVACPGCTDVHESTDAFTSQRLVTLSPTNSSSSRRPPPPALPPAARPRPAGAAPPAAGAAGRT